jgi:hypothetical protein
MKRFHELSENQQKAAIEFSYKTIMESIQLGILYFDAEFTAKLHDLAIDAAECGKYNNDGTPMIDDSNGDVPYFFQGGCI